MKIVISDLELCQDCMQYMETGDTTFLDYYYDEPESTNRLKEIERGIRELEEEHEGNLVCNFNTDNDTGSNQFSRSICDCCRSKLAGVRYNYSIIA